MGLVRWIFFGAGCWLASISPSAAQDANAMTFGMGNVIAQTIEKCDVAVTTAQRNGVTRKVETLRNEIPPRVAQETIAAFGPMRDCPAAARDKDDFQAALTAFLEKTPEQFAEFMRANSPAAAGAAPPPPQPAVRTVAGWRVDPDKCMIYRDYRDPDDKNLFNAVVLTRSKEATVISLEYENWRWSRGEQVRAKLYIDEKVVASSTVWTSPSGGTAMGARFDQSVLPFLAGAKLLELQFDDGIVADFKMPNVGQALAALESCAGR